MILDHSLIVNKGIGDHGLIYESLIFKSILEIIFHFKMEFHYQQYSFRSLLILFAFFLKTFELKTKIFSCLLKSKRKHKEKSSGLKT